MGDGAPLALGIADSKLRKIANAALRGLSAPSFVKDEVREELFQVLRAEAEGYRPGTVSLETYLFRRARYRAINLLRVHSRAHAHEVSLEELRGAVNETGYGEVEFWDAVDRALSKEQTHLLDLLLADTPRDTIAHELGIAPRTLFKRLRKLRHVLAVALFGVVDL